MKHIVNSILDEIGAMMSGHFVPYHKAAFMVASVVALLFSLILTHGTVFEGKIAVIDLDASHYSTELIQKINASPYIEVSQVMHSPINPEVLTAHDKNLGVLYIPKGLEKSLITGDQSFSLGYFIDTTNSAQNASVLEHLNAYIAEVGAEFGALRIAPYGFGDQQIEATLASMTLKNRHLFNPTNSATNSTTIMFVYFFSSLTYGLTTLMIIGRLKVTGAWERDVMNRGAFALMCRIIPYALFYTTALTIVTAVLTIFGQLRFEGNYFFYLPTIFMTGLAFGWLAMILSWKTNNPGEGAGKMVFLVPPGFIMGGATMAVGFFPLWAYYLSYVFPLVWQYRFYRDFAFRGQSLSTMLLTYGAYILFLTVIAFILVILFNRAKRVVV